MSEDEQGYAPAAYLEPVEGKTNHDHMVETDNSSSSEGEALQQYCILILTIFMVEYNVKITHK